MKRNCLQKLKIWGVALATVFTSGGFALMANAQTVNAAAPTDGLITPSSYEQYLPLTSPSYAAFSDDYTATADGNCIFIYDRLHGIYRRYEHTVNSDQTHNKISKVAFADDGDLYFLDASSYLYLLPAEALSENEISGPTKTNFACSTFLIEGNSLYYTTVTDTTATLSQTTLTSLDATTATPIVPEIHSKPCIAFYENHLYYTDYGIRLMRVSPSASTPKPEPVCVFDLEIKSLVINADELYCADTRGAFYAYNFTALTFEGTASEKLAITIDASENSVSLSSYENKIYLVQGKSVREYECGEGFTGFELSSSSDSENRLHGATDSVLYKDYLLTADAGNDRISVYTRSTNEYRVIPSVSGLLRVATDGETATAITKTQAIVYDFITGAPLVSFENFNGNLIGVASVYGAYYLVSDTNHYYKLTSAIHEETQERTWKMEGILKQNSKSPKLMTADLYGNLYVTAVNNVYKFKESEIMDELAFGEEICSSIPTESIKLLVDYKERVYTLYQNTVYAYENNQKIGEYALGKSLVYTQTTATPVTSIAFGVEDGVSYLTYDGNLVVSAFDIPLPTVKTIATEEVSEKVFEESTAEFSVVQTSENALLVAFDLEGTKDATYFDYQFYTRKEQPLTALKIGETAEYGVLAVFDKQAGKYFNFVVLKRYLTELDPSVYQKEYAPNEQKEGWLTNAVSLYKFPYLTPLLTSGSAVKNQKVTLLGEVTELDYDYYLISYETENGEQKTGFVPMSYLTSFNGAPLTAETSTYGEQAPDLDSVYRMTYLLLGTAAIALLINYLILRKKEN